MTELIDLIEEMATAAPDLADELTAIRENLEAPLRVAIAGRAKAGKSTLLNALVGERLAATDASECTKVVTEYREGIARAVVALYGDSPRELPFTYDQDSGTLTFDLEERAPDKLVVDWPSSRLGGLVLVDTPGLEAHDEVAEAATRRLLSGEEGPGDVDAVIYLMRHLHESDAEFLDSFMDESVITPAPVTAVAIVSRADEIGGGGLDSMKAAEDVAHRYRGDEAVGRLARETVAVAGLLAEAAAFLREDDFRAMTSVAGLDDETRARALLGVEQFRSESFPVEAEQRDRLLTTLGLFGVRLGVDAVATGKVSNSQELAELLDTVSGIAAVRGALNDRFGRRSGLLKMRTALQALRSLVRREKSLDGQAAALERIASGSLDGAHLRLLDQLPSLGWGEEVIEEIERLIGEGAPHERLGIPEGDDIRAEIATRVGEWRKRALHPAASPEAVDAAETMARTYEVLHAEVSQGGG